VALISLVELSRAMSGNTRRIGCGGAVPSRVRSTDDRHLVRRRQGEDLVVRRSCGPVSSRGVDPAPVGFHLVDPGCTMALMIADRPASERTSGP